MTLAPTTNKTGYAMGYSPTFLKLLKRRSATTHAAHLIPLLKSGMTMLDLGSGPGNLSLDLACAVYPGEFHAVDHDPKQVAAAQEPP